MHIDESLNGTLNADDYVAAQRLHLRQWRKRQRMILGVFAAIGIIVMTIGPFLLGAILFGAGAGGFFGELLLYTRSWPRAWRKLFAQQKALHESFRYGWDETGLHISTPLSHALRPWPYYLKHIEDEEILLLYHSDAMFELIPKRWPEHARLPDTFEALLLQHLGRSHHTNPPAPIATGQRLP